MQYKTGLNGLNRWFLLIMIIMIKNRIKLSEIKSYLFLLINRQIMKFIRAVMMFIIIIYLWVIRCKSNKIKWHIEK